MASLYTSCIQDTLSSRAALGLPAVQPLGRVRRARKCILHTSTFRASSNWTPRASPCRYVSSSFLSCLCLLIVGRASPGWLSRERHRAECRACFAILDVTRVIWFATGLPRAFCKNDTIYKWVNALSINTLYAWQDTLLSLARLT